MTPKEKIRLARIDGENRRQIEYSVAKFIEAYSNEDSPSSREDARNFATRLLANQPTASFTSPEELIPASARR
jgi:hypothetical protein